MRLEHKPPREMFRVLATAVTALRRAGIEKPAEHIAMLSQKDGRFVALLVKKTPFTKDEQDRLAQWTAHNPFIKLLVAPQLAPSGRNIYQFFLEAPNDICREAVYEHIPFNIRPATDDTPFFFNFSRWSHLPFIIEFSRWAGLAGMKNNVPVMETTLIVMFCLVAAAALLCVYLPLRYLHRANAAPTPRRHGFIFAGTALGYLAVEIALLQKFGLFLGHPNYALSVVLAGLLFATGLGALGSARLVQWSRGPRYISYAFALLAIVEYKFIFPHLGHWAVEAFGIRILIVLVLVMPLGILMGTYVPTAVEQLKKTAPDFVPWAWGINGVFSVLAPILSIALSMTWGITALFLSAIPIYLMVGWLYPEDSNERAKVDFPSKEFAASGKAVFR
jgi:hypothetical protein